INAWLPFRSQFLDEMLRMEGLGDHERLPVCGRCKVKDGEIRCASCMTGEHFCSNCVVLEHERLPFHRIERWNGQYFEKHTLCAAGQRLQLGHGGRTCPHPLIKPTPMTIIDISGVHEVYVDFCECGIIGAAHHFVQLLRASLWPATIERPQTAITLRTLKTFHALNLQSKLNAYDFWCSLVRLTDGIGTRPPKYRYREFIRVARFYRNVRALKRSARGHDPAGIEATAPGALVVQCPQCPQPGINMPDGWEDAPEGERWKHAMFIAMDANFKMKLKNRGLIDTELSPGWGYFVEQNAYSAHCEKYQNEPEPKYCDSNHSAVDKANMPAQRRFSINGVGAVVCSRHCFYLRHSLGRYASMDYMLLSALALSAPAIKTLYISYDIACSFSKNFQTRMPRYPVNFHIDPAALRLKWGVPKFHLIAHGPKCQTEYSLNNTWGVGRTHGEGVETGWAELNGFALSTREMTGPARQENLDDACGGINWRKTISIPPGVKKSLKVAVEALRKQRIAFAEACDSIPQETQEEWSAMMRAYEDDKTAPNPYEEPVVAMSMVDVRLELAEEEAREAALGQVSPHETTASMFLTVGFELEEQQRTPKDRHNSTEKVALREKQAVLRHRIASWRPIQQLYIPCISQLLSSSQDDTAGDAPAVNNASSASGHPENETLYLPSQLPLELRLTGCVSGLAEKELRLRLAQAEDSLYQVRRALRIRHTHVHFKRVHIAGPGQNANTRARTFITRLMEKVTRYAQRYRGAYSALLQLDPDGNWKHKFRELRDSDLRGPRQEPNQLGKGHFEATWIWRNLRPDIRDVPGADEDATEEEITDSVRVDWVNAKARVERWEEEIELLQVEMVRAVCFMRARAHEWRALIISRPDVRPDIAAGLNAYAHRQAAQFEEIGGSFIAFWKPVLAGLELPDLWPEVSATPATFAPGSGLADSAAQSDDGAGSEGVAHSDDDAGSEDGEDDSSDELDHSRATAAGQVDGADLVRPGGDVDNIIDDAL
ncbi:hypothetical protein FA95DRAFT_1504888, partial [Auriscalpium vulgare]